MPTVADVFIRYRKDYLRQFGPGMLPSHRRTIRNIVTCRTKALGGSLYRCTSCGRKHYSYHSCGDRHCPVCGHDAATRWARKTCALIPRVPCFLVGFTVPHRLNGLIRSHQKALYGLLFSASSSALNKLCADPRHLGARPGMLGILHTWARDTGYHPHVHYLVPAGGVDAKGRWVPTRYPDFLVPVQALSVIFRAKVRDGLKDLGLFDQVPPEVWKRPWVVHAEPAGHGPEVIRYFARYLYRVALTNTAVLAVNDDRVTFRYRTVDTKRSRTMTLPALVFMARFLQHVLPRRFAKVRYYGFLHPRARRKLDAVRRQLALPPVRLPPDEPARPMVCMVCRQPLVLLGTFPRSRAPP